MSSFDDTTEPKVYVADLGAYVAGELRGAWFAPSGYDDADAFAHAVQEFIERRPGAEEWAIHDYDGFGSIRLGEYESLQRVYEIACAIAEHGGAYSDYASNVGLDFATPEGFEEAYCGQYESGADYAADLAEESEALQFGRGGELRWPLTCIDWDRAWCELEYDGYWISPSGHVFRAV